MPYKSTAKVPGDAWHSLGQNYLVLGFESVLSHSSEEGELDKTDAVVSLCSLYCVVTSDRTGPQFVRVQDK